MRFKLVVALVCAFAAHAATAAAAPRLLAGAGTRAAQGKPLHAQVLTGSTDVWVSGVRRPRFALLGLDHRPATKGRKRIRLAVHKQVLRPWLLDTTKLKDGRHVLNARVARRHGKPVRLKAAFRVDNHGARTDQLIATALASHRIDLGRSLLYRFYAFLGDPRLPAAYHGAPPADDAVAMDARAALTAGTVKGKEAKQLRRYLLRPTDPRSPLYAGAHAARAAGCGRDSAAPEIGTGDKRLWAWQDRREGWFPGAYKWVQRLGSRNLAKEEADMGAAAPDGPADCANANPTQAVDVYLVNGAAATISRTAQVAGAGNYAIAVPDRCSDGRCSGFIMLNLAATSLDRRFVETTLVHELYHVLQYARMSAWTPQWPWLTEAGATWAEGHYGPSNPFAVKYSADWYSAFQADAPGHGVGRACNGCQYQYWIWPLFLTQEGASMAQAWSAVAAAPTDDAVNQALNAYFPFAAHLRDFAVRDLNRDYHEQGGAAGRRFQTGAGGWPAAPATGTPARELGQVALTDTHDKAQTFSATTPYDLDFETQHFTLPDKNHLRRVKLDFSALGPNTDVDLLVHVAGKSGLERRRLAGQTFTFCRDDAADAIDDIIAVYSNHSIAGPDHAPVQPRYQGSTTCGKAVTEWKGTWSSRDRATNGEDVTWTVTSSADFSLDTASSRSNYWLYALAPDTPAQVSVTGHSTDCSWSGSGTDMTQGTLEVQDPHTDTAYWALSMSPVGTIPVTMSCTGEPDQVEQMSGPSDIHGRGEFTMDLDEISDSQDVVDTYDDHLMTWNLGAVSTGDAP
jgi:hypothetical protein